MHNWVIVAPRLGALGELRQLAHRGSQGIVGNNTSIFVRVTLRLMELSRDNSHIVGRMVSFAHAGQRTNTQQAATTVIAIGQQLDAVTRAARLLTPEQRDLYLRRVAGALGRFTNDDLTAAIENTLVALAARACSLRLAASLPF